MRGLKKVLSVILAIAIIFTNVNIELLAAEPKVNVEEAMEVVVEENAEATETTVEKKVETAVTLASNESDFSYEELNGTYIAITGYTGTDTEVTIPEQIGEYTVQRIESGAFQESAVTYVKIPDSVKSIGNSAFSESKDLAEIEFGTGLETIESWAFSGCLALQTISLPENVLTIGSGTFYECSSITEIRLPDSVTEIGSNAFAGCSALTSINYPMSLESAGNAIFENATSLHKIEVPEGVTKLADGAFKNCTYLTEIILPDTLETIGGSSLEGCSGLTSITLPDSLKEIGNWGMYNCPNLVELTLSDGMTTLGKYALSNCTSLTALTLPDSITTMKEGALSACTNLESVNYPKSLVETGQMIYEGCTKLKTITVPEGVTELPDSAFKNCTNFSEIILPATLEVIQGGALEGCSGLQSITLPEGLKEIGQWGMYNNPGLVSLHIPDSVETIGQYALANCVNLKTVNYPLSLKTAGKYIFDGSTKLTRITVPEGVTEVPENAFYGCASLVKITLPESLVKINDAGFDTCTGIERMVLPDNVESIGAYAFSACYGLTDIWIGEKVTSIQSNSFNVCDTAKLTIHGVEGSYAQTWAEEYGYTFSTEVMSLQDLTIQGTVTDSDGTGISDTNIMVYDCSNLKVVAELTTDANGAWSFEEAESGVKYRIRYSHGDYDFSESMQELTVEAENEPLSVTGTIAFTGEEASSEDFTYTVLNGSEIELTGYTGSAEVLAIPAEIDGYVVKELGENLFKNNTELKEIKIPAGVTTINGNAFYNCSSLEKVRFAGKTTTLGGYCFQNCTALKEVALPSGLLSIKNGVFYNCVSLESIELPDSVNEIGSYAFEKCSALTEINYPMSLSSAGTAIFQNAVNLKKIEVPEGVKELADSAFKNCTYLTEIVLPETLEVIGGSSLEGCSGLTSITLPTGLKEIGNWGMYSCPNLTELTLPEGMTTLGKYALSNCTSLTVLTLPDSITTMREGALSDCTNLESVNYPMSLQETGQMIYEGCTKLKTITVPEGVTELPDSAFKNCSNFTEIILPETLEVIHGAGLEGCSGLKSITLPEGLKEIGQWGMYNNPTLVSLHIPDSVEKIGQYALANCVNLKTVNYPLSLKTTGKYIFDGSTKLTRITVPEGVTEIPENAFYGCTSLVKITFPDSLVKINDAGFDTCTGIERMVLPDNVESIGAYAFSACYGLTDIWIGEKVTSIHDYSFNVCDTAKLTIHGVEGSYAQVWAEEHGYTFSTEVIGLQDLTIQGNVKDQDGNGISDVNITVYDCKNLKIQAQLVTDETGAWSFEEAETGVTYRVRYSHGDYDFSESMQEITAAAENVPLNVTGAITFTGEEASAEEFTYIALNGSEIELTGYTGSAEVLVIPAEIDGYVVKELGENLFKNNTVLKEVKIPSGVTTINGNAFYNCSSLEKVRFAGNTTTLGGYCFQNCTALTDVVLPAGLLSIKNGVFYNCVSLKAIELPDSVNEIGSYAFEKCSGLTEINYPMSLSSAGTAIFQNAVNLKKIEVPEGVKKLADSAFKNCTYLTEIILPDTLEVIGGSSLEGCSGLTSITLPEGLKEIGNWGMYNCPNIAELTLPDGMTILGQYALSKCSALTELVLPDSITTMKRGALSNCTNLESVNYPKSLTETGQEIYYGCTKLTTITVPEGVTELPDSAFKNCSNFSEIILPDTLEVIHGAGLEGCSGLTNIILPEGLKEIGNWGIYNCEGLVSLQIPDGVEKIGQYALAECTNLEEVNYPTSLKETGTSIFNNDKKLRKISIPEGVTIIPENAFKNANYLRYLEIPSTLKEIQDAAFEGCIGLPYIVLNSGLESIGNYSFNGCDGLIDVTVPGTVVSIGTGAFQECINLESATINAGTTSIGRYAFRNCAELTDVYIADSVSTFGDNIFEGCESVTIHCKKNSQASVYAIRNGLNLEFFGEIETDESQGVLDTSASGYELFVSDAMSKGYITGKVKYSVKEAETALSNMSIGIKFPANTAILFDSIRLNGLQVTDYEFEDDILNIPCSEISGELTISLKPETDKRYDTYAVLNYKKNNIQNSEVIGVVSEEIVTLSINADETVSELIIPVSGVAPSKSQVEIAVNGEVQQTVTALKNGKYSATVDLGQGQTGDCFEISVSVFDSNNEIHTTSTEVWYVEDEPKLARFDMYYNNHNDAKQDLLDTSAQGKPLSFNPAYPFRFVIEFENNERIENVEVQSNKNGVIKTIKAVYDSATNTYVASGYFGDTKNYVPGALSVVYKTAASQSAPVTQEQLVNFNNRIFSDAIANSVTTYETEDDGTTKYTTTFENEEDSIFGSKELKYTVKTIDMLTNKEFSAFFDAYEAYEYYLDSKSDKYWLTVIDNFVDDPTSGTPGLLILVGDTASNNVTKYFLQYGAGLSETALLRVGATGKAIKAVGKVFGAHVDAEKLRDKVMNGNYTPEEQARLLKEIDLYEKSCKIYNVMAGIVAVTFALNPGMGLGLYAFYSLTGMIIDDSFEQWKGMLENGHMLFGWIIDPSGYVYEAITKNRLKGVKATVYYKNALGVAVLWDATEYQQENPVYTDSDGVYAWDVPEGQWRVKYEMAGYETAYSEWYDVPPAQTEVHMGMVSTEDVEIKSVNTYTDFTEIIFSQYVSPDALSQIVLKDAAGNEVQAETELIDEGTHLDGTTYAKGCKLKYQSEQGANSNLKIELPEIVSYNGSKTKAQTVEKTCVSFQQIVLEDSYTVKSGENLEIQGEILNYTGKEQISCEMDMAGIVNLENITQPDAAGKFTISFKSISIGETGLKVFISNTSVEAKTSLVVEPAGGTTHVHSWDAGVVTEQASFAGEGAKEFICGSCQKTYTEAIPKVNTPVLASKQYVYNGSAKKPAVTLTDADGNELVKGTDYDVTYASGRKNVGRYAVTVTLKGNYSGTKKVYFTIVPKKTSSLTSIRYQYGNQVRLSWKKVTGASGYRVEYKKPGASKYTFLKNTTSLTYTKGGLTANKTYYFKVTPYVTVSGTKYYGTSSSAYKTTSIATVTKGKKLAQVSKPTITKSGTKVKVKWKNIANETGYEISQSTSKTGTKIVSTYKTSSGTSKLVAATKGKTYYYKVRAYRTVNGKKIYGAWSTVVKYKR